MTLLHGGQPVIEQSLQQAFEDALAYDSAIAPQAIGAQAGRRLRGCWIVFEAERGGWSRYRVLVRVRSENVTIATVEVIRAEQGHGMPCPCDSLEFTTQIAPGCRLTRRRAATRGGCARSRSRQAGSR